MQERTKQKGLIQIPLLVIIVVSFVLASGIGTGIFLYKKRGPELSVENGNKEQVKEVEKQERNPAIATPDKQVETDHVEQQNENTSSGCPVDTPLPVLSADFTDISVIREITAPGTSTSDWAAFKGHSFIWTDGILVSLYAPIDAVLESGAFYNELGRGQYVVSFRTLNQCGYYMFRFDHVHQVIDSIKNALNQVPDQQSTQGRQPTAKVIIRAGEKIGETSGNVQSGNWDFGFYDMLKEGPLAQVGARGISRNAVCWVDYFSPEKQSFYRSRLIGPKTVCNF